MSTDTVTQQVEQPEPPREDAPSEEKGPFRRILSGAMQLALKHVAKGYIAGPTVLDARRQADIWAKRGIPCTFGYWHAGTGEAPDAVLKQYLLALDHMHSGEYLSIKLTALDFSDTLLDELAESAATKNLRIHFDAMGPETAERTRTAVERFHLRQKQRFPIGYTLPGRWARSTEDAAWAQELGLPVRVVKGQFPEAAATDPYAGFQRVVRTLAGGRTHVAVATHNFDLAQDALQLLRERGTSHELELLFGLPTRKNLALASSLGTRSRIYIGYGTAWLPYLVDRVIDNPKMLAWVTRDLFHL